MEAPLEIRYAGVTIGRAQEVRSAEGDVPSFFIPVRDPMPVGTVLRMRSGDRETPVRVVRAVETTDAATCGMQVRMIGDAEEVALEFIPPPALVVEKIVAEKIVAEKVKPGTPTPVVEVDLASMAEITPPAATAPANSPASIPVPASDPTPVVEVAVTTPAVETAVAAPAVETVSGSSGAAVPEAVPMVVGSSMTGALRSATESVSVGAPAPAASAEPSGQATAGPLPDSAKISQPENGAVAEAAPDAGRSTAAYGGQATELPPARPIAGPSGRRKTKRRK